MRWFRFYEDTMNDPKVQRLPAELFRFWINMLCLASRGDGKLPNVQDIAFALRLPEAKATDRISLLFDAGLLDKTETGIEPHNWNGRQYQSDSASERMKRYRQRKRDEQPPSPITRPLRNPCVTGDVPETETETETETERSPLSPPLGGGRAKGTRLAEDWEPGPSLVAWCKTKHNLDDDLIREITAEHRDYWCAVPGSRGLKLSWDGAFRHSVARFLDRRKPSNIHSFAKPNGQKPRMTRDEARKILAS